MSQHPFTEGRGPETGGFDPYGERTPRARAAAAPRSAGSVATVVFWAVAAALVLGRLAVSVEAPVQTALAPVVQALASR